VDSVFIPDVGFLERQFVITWRGSKDRRGGNSALPDRVDGDEIRGHYASCAAQLQAEASGEEGRVMGVERGSGDDEEMMWEA
jgi:hypothetical protein